MDYAGTVVAGQRDYQKKLLEYMEKEMPKMPGGRLVCKQQSGGCYYYEKGVTGKSTYLSIKNDSDKIALLKRKAVFKKDIAAIKSNLKIFEKFLRDYRELKSIDILLNKNHAFNWGLSGEIRRVAEKGILGDRETKAWENAPYKSNYFYQGELVHVSIKGRRLRSKSELAIANMMELMGISFRYEERLELGNHVTYPDFVVKRPRDGKIIYWEHFGMIGKEEYEKNMEEKLRLYRRNGITMWDNLIVTFDSEDGVLDTQTIAGIIQAFLL